MSDTPLATPVPPEDSSDSVRAAALAIIAEERAAWHATVVEIGPDRMMQPGPMGDWTFRDLVDHLNGWRERSLDRLRAEAAGQPEPPPRWPTTLATDDAVNDWLRERHRDRPVDEVLAAYDRSFAELATLIASLPRGLLTEPGRFTITEGAALQDLIVDRTFFGHWHEEHEPDVRAWLAATA